MLSRAHILGFVLDDLHAPGRNGVRDSTKHASVEKHVARWIDDVVIVAHVLTLLMKNLRNPRLGNEAGGSEFRVHQ